MDGGGNAQNPIFVSMDKLSEFHIDKVHGCGGTTCVTQHRRGPDESLLLCRLICSI